MRAWLLIPILLCAIASGRTLTVRVSDDGRAPYDPETKGFAHISFQNAVLGKLVRLNARHQLEPALLETAYWDYEQSGYLLRLPAGLKFHNGRTAKAEDIDFSLVRYFLTTGRADPVAFLAGIRGVESLRRGGEYRPWMASGIRKVDDRTVFIHLRGRDPNFLFSLSLGWVSLVPREELAADLVTWKRVPVGAGAYRVVEIQGGGSRVRLERVSPIAESDRPDAVEFVSDPTVHADLVGFVPERPGGRHYEKIYGRGPVGFSGIFFNYESPLGNDIHFRRALSLATDRSALVAKAEDYTPLYELLTSNFIGRLRLGKSEDLALARAELAKVPKHLLRDPIRAFGFDAREKLGAFESSVVKALVAQWARVGIRVKFLPSSNPLFAPDDKSTVLRIDERGTGFVDPLGVLYAFESGYLSRLFPRGETELGRLLVGASAAGDLAKKAAAVREISRLFAKNAYVVPLYEKKLHYWIDPTVVKDIGAQHGVALDIDQVRMRPIRVE